MEFQNTAKRSSRRSRHKSKKSSRSKRNSRKQSRSKRSSMKRGSKRKSKKRTMMGGSTVETIFFNDNDIPKDTNVTMKTISELIKTCFTKRKLNSMINLDDLYKQLDAKAYKFADAGLSKINYDNEQKIMLFIQKKEQLKKLEATKITPDQKIKIDDAQNKLTDAIVALKKKNKITFDPSNFPIKDKLLEAVRDKTNGNVNVLMMIRKNDLENSATIIDFYKFIEDKPDTRC